MIPLSYKMTYYLLWKSAVVEIEPQRYWKHWLTCAHALKGLFVRTMLKACCVLSAVILRSNYKWQVSFLNSLILTILLKMLLNHFGYSFIINLLWFLRNIRNKNISNRSRNLAFVSESLVCTPNVCSSISVC